MTVDRALFRHTHILRVRNYEVDWQGIVHNGNYLLYCEVGRVEYLKTIGATVDLNSINSDSRVVLVRNEVDYRAPARFDDELIVRTRIASIRRTSFTMEGILERKSTGEIVAENVAVHVWLDPATERPTPVPASFRALVKSYEGDHCSIASPDGSRESSR